VTQAQLVKFLKNCSISDGLMRAGAQYITL